MSTPTHFIYDLDGLLLDTEIFYTEVTQKIVSEFGHNFTWDLKSRMMGRQAAESARLLVDALKLPITPEEYLERRDADLSELFLKTKCKPGALELIATASMRGIIQSIGTSSNTKNFNLKTAGHYDMLKAMTTIVTGDDPEIRAGKPAPDIYLLVAKRLNVSPSNCVVFEDSLSGVKAGVRAGMKVIAVPDPNMDKADFHEADLVLDSLALFDFEQSL